ncbi:MAG: hypothetical protein WCT27_02555 [Patescibacteria group bacterium]|jgi:hypothetical protein
MKRKLFVSFVVVASLALTVGIAQAAGMATDWLRVGSQSAGGVTYFNGTIINNTTGTGGANNPVTFGDNVRIDGRVYRGSTAGTSDAQPFIVNDNLEVAGALTVTGTITGNVAYDHTVSGLNATTVKSAIDELATTVGKAVSGTGLVSASAGVKAAALSVTTWKGYAYYITDSYTNSSFATAPEVTVTFTPTTETQGTYSTTPYNAFKVPSMEQPGEDAWCRLGLTGSYQIVGDKLFIYGFTWTDPYGYPKILLQVKVRGNTMELYPLNYGGTYVTYLTKQ